MENKNIDQYILTNQQSSDLLVLKVPDVITRFRSKSLILFRNFKVENQTFREFTDKFGKDFASYAGGSHKRARIDGNKDTLAAPRSTYGGYAIPAHAELSYTAIPPKIIWFFCSVAPKAAGQTTVYDGVEVWNRLSTSTRKIFETKKIKYTAHYPENRWDEIYQADTVEAVSDVCRRNGVKFAIGGSVPGERHIHTEYTCWAMQPTAFTGETAFVNHMLSSIYAKQFGITDFLKVNFEDNSSIPDHIVDELYDVTESVSIDIDLRQGDTLMIDNTRFLHGRRAFFGKREVQLRMCLQPIEELGYETKAA